MTFPLSKEVFKGDLHIIKLNVVINRKGLWLYSRREEMPPALGACQKKTVAMMFDVPLDVPRQPALLCAGQVWLSRPFSVFSGSFKVAAPLSS